MAQRLAHAQSAYLRQHADNPVDWWPWGDDAFAEAQRRDVPVFVSIGYAACHWCHVMAGESFADPATAETLNERFVSVKVDREEHPDVDDTYMAAVQAMTGQGGWPMSVFTLPDGRVFHGGTYFPPHRMGQVPSFSEVLEAVHQAWTQRRDQVEEQAGRLAEAMGRQRRHQSLLATEAQNPAATGIAADTGVLSAQRMRQFTTEALEALADQEDTVHGGFGAAPKFPPSPLLGFLLEEAAWHPDSPAAGMAIRTLETMARSALFDQVEGGFARYATDRAWSLPHFEKMLSDNAQLLGLYARLSEHPAASAAQRADARRTAQMTLRWLHESMMLPAATAPTTSETHTPDHDDDAGLFASSRDADTVVASGQRVEGATYLFSDEELAEAALAAGFTADEADRVVRLNAGVPADEHALARSGHTGEPLHVLPGTARTLHFDGPLGEEDRRLWDRIQPELRRRRTLRPQPARDEKVVAAWNAQTIQAIAEAAALWNDAHLLEWASRSAQTLWDVHVRAGDTAYRENAPRHSATATVIRTSYAGQAGARVGTLTDHAQLASACFALLSAGASDMWGDRGAALLRAIGESAVVDSTGAISESLEHDAFLATAQNGPLLATPLDGPEPSGIAALAQALQAAAALGVEVPVRATDVLHHLEATAGKVPSAVGASLLAGRRCAAGSPAFRVHSGSADEVAAVRRAGVLYGIPVEPVPAQQHQAEQPLEAEPGSLSLSVCLNEPGRMLCLPPVGGMSEALSGIAGASPLSPTPRT